MGGKYHLSQRSTERLSGVHLSLRSCVNTAIEITTVDFGVTEGLRTEDRQAELVAKGLSQTMKSKHLDGSAVDLVGYIGGRVSWEMSAYFAIAEAMKAAALKHSVPLRWGGAWHCPDIRFSEGNMEELHWEYVDLRRSEGRKPFIDGPHFELNY